MDEIGLCDSCGRPTCDECLSESGLCEGCVVRCDCGSGEEVADECPTCHEERCSECAKGDRCYACLHRCCSCGTEDRRRLYHICKGCGDVFCRRHLHVSGVCFRCQVTDSTDLPFKGSIGGTWTYDTERRTLIENPKGDL